ncbi:MAG: DUF29 domain-containing protein [Snowella sp.]|nr:DUF29 domain-containing protein [Snowella sp.]
MAQTPTTITLYEQDYLRWTEETAHSLRNKKFDCLDLENLIEEIEDLGKSQRRELESRLEELLEHILKRTYVNLPECYRGWVESVDKQRLALRRLLKSSPSLKPYFWEIFDEAYYDALRIVARSYPQVQFPKQWPFEQSIEALLTTDFWEAV